MIAVILNGCNKPIAQPEGKVIVDSENYPKMPGDYQWKEKDVEINTLSSLEISRCIRNIRSRKRRYNKI